MNATIRILGWGMLPLSALMGGLQGGRFGLLLTLTIAVAISCSPFLWLLLHLLRVIVPVEPTEATGTAIAGRGERTASGGLSQMPAGLLSDRSG